MKNTMDDTAKCETSLLVGRNNITEEEAEELLKKNLRILVLRDKIDDIIAAKLYAAGVTIYHNLGQGIFDYVIDGIRKRFTFIRVDIRTDKEVYVLN